MKKVLKLLACLLAVICFVCSLAGCDALDASKEAQGFWTEEGNIMLNDAHYLKLNYSGELLSNINGNFVFVTESDVPALLSQSFGDRLHSTEDGVLLRYHNTLDSTYYCRSDYYGKVMSSISSGLKLNGYCYSYFNFDESNSLVTKTYTLTPEQVAAVNTVLNTEPVYLDVEEFVPEIMVILDKCDDTSYFRESAYEICVYRGNYYVYEYATLHQVPDDLKDIFDEIMKAEFGSTGSVLTPIEHF